MAYAMLTTYSKESHSLSAAGLFLRGFAKGYKLNEAELSQLPTLIAARLACSATLGAFSYSQDPGNEYLLLHSEPCWKALEMFWNADRELVSEFFSLAYHNVDGDNIDELCVPDPTVADVFKSARSEFQSQSKKRKLEATTTTTTPTPITFVTGNKKKLEEVTQIMNMDENQLVSKKLDLPEVSERASRR